ncbi:MAG: TonB-dependent receptor [Alphaproteobacteria bacterium]|nr:TonB-dependent receptor [Alphaproteobacteria bacterium]
MISAPSLTSTQEAGPPAREGGSGEAGEDIVVVATRMAGQVDTDIPPVLTLDGADIASYGASSISELLDAVSTQTGSGRGRGGGRPVILLNGQRVSSFREMRSIPPEAIRRMEVLPEEVALRFGYPANQRVVNFTLKDNFSSVQTAGEYNVPTRGGYLNWELEVEMLRIDGPRRMNLEAKIVETSLLTEAERGILQDPSELAALPPGVDPGRYRSLTPENREITLNGTWSTGLEADSMGGTFSANGAYTRTDSRSLSGLDGLLLEASPQELRALESKTGTDLVQGGLALNKPLGDWLLSVTSDAGYTNTTTRIDLPGGKAAARELAQSKDLALSSLATIAGRPFTLPAGEASLTVKAGFDLERSDNADKRGGASSRTALKRGDLSAGANLSLPLTSRRKDVLSAIGDLSINASAGLNRLSDFGTLTDWSAGLTWKPTGKLTLQASYLVNEAAPSLSQLGAPQVVSFNVPVYDFVRGETALVTVTGGGNTGLLTEKQRDWKISANWELPFLDGSSLLAEYFRNTSRNVTQSFPLLTPAIEAAFPGRAVRDASGMLVSIDRRPVTFDRVESSRLRWGLNLSGRLSKPEEGRESGRGERGEGARGGGGGGPRMAMMPGRGGPPGGRWNLSVYHALRFTDRVTIAAGGPVLDQLDGKALRAGGVPRHELFVEGGVFKDGLGLRLGGTWRAPTTLESSGAPGTSDLRFGSTFNANARMFINLDQHTSLAEKAPFLRGVRIAFTIDNILDSRQKVTDEAGLIPLAYQRAYREPQGQVVGIDIRKLF